MSADGEVKICVPDRLPVSTSSGAISLAVVYIIGAVVFPEVVGLFVWLVGWVSGPVVVGNTKQELKKGTVARIRNNGTSNKQIFFMSVIVLKSNLFFMLKYLKPEVNALTIRCWILSMGSV